MGCVRRSHGGSSILSKGIPRRDTMTSICATHEMYTWRFMRAIPWAKSRSYSRVAESAIPYMASRTCDHSHKKKSAFYSKSAPEVSLLWHRMIWLLFRIWVSHAGADAEVGALPPLF